MKNLQIVLRAKWMLQKPYNFFLSWTPTHCSFTHCDSNISQSTSFLSVKEWRIFNFWFCFIFTKVCFFVQQKGWTLRGYSRKIFDRNPLCKAPNYQCSLGARTGSYESLLWILTLIGFIGKAQDIIF